jgi:hypothetical protein
MKRIHLNFPFRPVIIYSVTSEGLESGTTLVLPGWKHIENSEKGVLVQQKKRVQERLCEWDSPVGHPGQFGEHLCFMYAPNFQHLQLAVLYLLGHFLRQL